jgi:ribosome-binding protein aMBF1 (putative translation factor)
MVEKNRELRQWDELEQEIYSVEEIAESDLRIALISELINARKEKGISQRDLEKLSGIRQPVIARIERGATAPQIDTVMKLLLPLGKTLAVVPIETRK